MLSELLVGLSEPPANMTIARCDSVFGLLRGTFAARRTIPRMLCIQLLLQPYKSGIFLLEMKTRKTEENRFEWLGISIECQHPLRRFCSTVLLHLSS